MAKFIPVFDSEVEQIKKEIYLEVFEKHYQKNKNFFDQCNWVVEVHYNRHFYPFIILSGNFPSEKAESLHASVRKILEQCEKEIKFLLS
jgi:hypothetical protein